MLRRLVFIVILLTSLSQVSQGQVKIRLFANKQSGSATFTVNSGKYKLESFPSSALEIGINQPLVIARFNGRLVVKMLGEQGIVCDSLRLFSEDSTCTFSLRLNSNTPARQNYSGDLYCYEDMNTLLFINQTEIEKYIAGVVLAEGGAGKHREFYKTQSIIARTYMYKYFDKHLNDRYNLCDNTHCQAYFGTSSDTTIVNATFDTRNLVIQGPDSALIISAFHSNCGGETVSAQDVWITNQPYFKKVTDPYCTSSRNAIWERKITLAEWVAELKKSGYNGPVDDPSKFVYSVKTRSNEYKAGTFSVPVNTLRNDLQLRSTFFSVEADSNYVTIKGRGYGHGVGLCQEGAMVMAAKGFNYKQIIEFYYFGVNITDVKNAINLSTNLPHFLGDGGH